MKLEHDAEIVDALRQVLDYLYEQEQEHFEACPPEERAGHIFLALERLRDWLAGRPQ